MRRLLVLLTGHHSVIVLLTSLLLMDGILIASWFVPALGTFLDDHNVFPLIAITCFIEILLLLSVRVLQETPLALTDELSKHKIRELIDEHKDIRTVLVLSAGLRSRADLLRSLLEHPSRLQVKVVACFSEANPDELDRTRFGPAHYEVLTNRLSADEASRLQIYQSHNSPSVRGRTCRCLSIRPRSSASRCSASRPVLSSARPTPRNPTSSGRRRRHLMIDRLRDADERALREILPRLIGDPAPAAGDLRQLARLRFSALPLPGVRRRLDDLSAAPAARTAGRTPCSRPSGSAGCR